MGSINTAETAEYGGRPSGKIEASLNKELSSVEWGKYKLGDLFDSFTGNFDIQKEHINNCGEYVITSGLTNNGILGKSDVKAKIFDDGTITVDMFGNAFYRQFKYKMVTHARVFSLKPKLKITDRQGLFISNALFFLKYNFGYENMCSWEKIKEKQIQLPCLNGKINFSFMEKFIAELEAQRIAELEAYLSVTGLKDTHLSFEEEQALQEFKNIEWGEFAYKEIFTHIKQGRRLKKDDHITGNTPFVMSGTTNTGVVGYIANPVATFPKNSITIDIFGNSFYRNYDFGAGDDTGVYWNTKTSYSKEAMLFMTSAMEKSIAGKYSYGKKLRSSQSLDFKMKLPVINGYVDFQTMETLISAIQKLVIKDVVSYADSKISATKAIINQ
ncbi:MAG: restriction endonuclease subunit S [Anaerovoracaceae bacterium]